MKAELKLGYRVIVKSPNNPVERTGRIVQPDGDPKANPWNYRNNYYVKLDGGTFQNSVSSYVDGAYLTPVHIAEFVDFKGMNNIVIHANSEAPRLLLEAYREYAKEYGALSIVCTGTGFTKEERLPTFWIRLYCGDAPAWEELHKKVVEYINTH